MTSLVRQAAEAIGEQLEAVSPFSATELREGLDLSRWEVDTALLQLRHHGQAVVMGRTADGEDQWWSPDLARAAAEYERNTPGTRVH